MKRVLFAVLFAMPLCCASMAQDTRPANQFPTSQPVQPLVTVPDGVPVLSPSATWIMPHNASICGMAVSPDGRHVYVSLTYSAIHFWSLIVYYWPEAFSIIVMVLIVLVIRRTVRYPNSNGDPHCKRCTYQLTKLDSPICPECGAELTAENRIIGKPRRWLLALLLTLLAFQILFSMAIPGFVPREGVVNNWVNVNSPALYEWAAPRGWRWMLRHSAAVTAIVEFDVNSGEMQRVFDEHVGWTQGRTLLVAPDGRTLVAIDNNEVIAIDLSTSKQLFRNAMDLPVIQATIDASDNALVLIQTNWSVVLCDARTGQSRFVDRQKHPVQTGFATLVLDTSKVLGYQIAATESGEWTRDSSITLWDLKSQSVVSQWPFPDFIPPQTIPASILVGDTLVTPDNNTLVWLTEVKTGSRRSIAVPQTGPYGLDRYSVNRDASLAIVPTIQGGFYFVCDLRRGELIAAIRQPRMTAWPAAIMSHDRVFQTVASTTPAQQRVDVFDVGLLMTPAASQPN